jgi:sec-independent protein translocase protein TatA
MPSIGPLELIIVLVIVLLIFGPKRLPGLGRQLGSGMREFKDGITGKGKDKAEIEAAEDNDAAERAFGDEPRKARPEPAAVAGVPGEPEPGADEPAPVVAEPRPPEAPRTEA